MKLITGRWYVYETYVGGAVAVSVSWGGAAAATAYALAEHEWRLLIVALTLALVGIGSTGIFVLWKGLLRYATFEASEFGFGYRDWRGQQHEVGWDSVSRLVVTWSAMRIEYARGGDSRVLRMWAHRYWDNGLGEAVMGMIRDRAKLTEASQRPWYMDGPAWPITYRRKEL